MSWDGGIFYLVWEIQGRNMFYRFSSTSSKESNLVPLRSCCLARLIDRINSLSDIIFRVSFILFQSSRLKTTDFGLPSGVVINSISGNPRDFAMFLRSYPLFVFSLAKGVMRVNADYPWVGIFDKNLSWEDWMNKEEMKGMGEVSPLPPCL